jgi:hypothetical protein
MVVDVDKNVCEAYQSYLVDWADPCMSMSGGEVLPTILVASKIDNIRRPCSLWYVICRTDLDSTDSA